MKTAGTLILAICPIIFGIGQSINLKLNKKQVEKIILLINWFINEIKFCQTNLNDIIKNCCNQQNFKSLTFLENVKLNLNQMPFPQAWEHAVNNWQCALNYDDKNIVKSLSNILGAFDVNGQILSLKHINSILKQHLILIQNDYYKKSKMSKSLGILLGCAIYIILI